MVKVVATYKTLLHRVMKIAGMRPQKVEIEKGTIINFWVPSKSQKKCRNNPHKKNKQQKLAVVLLHGFAADGLLTWQFQVLALARKYAVYVPDFVFFGGSTTDKEDRSVEFQAECVAKGLKKLGVEKCCVAGFSYGGFVGFKMAEMYSEMVQSLVVSGSVTDLVDSFSGPALERIGGFSSWSQYLLPRTVDGVRVLFNIATYKKIRLPNFLLQDCLEEICVYEKKREELLEAMVKKDQDVVIPKYKQKIHLIWGENDMIYSLEVANNLKMQVGENAELHIIPKAGLLLMLERPCVFNSCFKKILASQMENGATITN